ncbi:zinc finger, CCHC-type containing protein [Tanacetum coccineum]
MGDENLIRTLGDYSKPSHEGLGNTIELPVGNNVRRGRKNDIYKVATSDDSKETDGPDMKVSVKEVETKNGAKNGAKNKPIKKPEKEEVVEAPSSQPVKYYLKHRINEKLIEGLVDNNRGPVCEAILKKKITKKEDIRGNFEIPCSMGGLKHVNALVDQGSDLNIMPYSTYMKLTDERPAETDIRLSLASHSYIYPLGIAENVLVEIAEHVYPMDFVILDIKEDEKRPFILGTPFLTTAKAVIKFDKGTITLRSERSKISFHRIPESPGTIERGVKNDIEPIAPTMTVNRLVLEWEEKIRLHQEKEIEFDRWRNKNFKNEHPALTKVKGGMDDEGEVTCRNEMGRGLAQRLFRRRPIAKGVGLCLVDSHAGNHLEDGFTPLETIQRLLVVIGRRSHSGLEREAFKPDRRPAEITADLGESLKAGVFIVHPGSVAASIKERKCKMMGDSSRSPMKRKLASGLLSSHAVRAKPSASKDNAPILEGKFPVHLVLSEGIDFLIHPLSSLYVL